MHSIRVMAPLVLIAALAGCDSQPKDQLHTHEHVKVERCGAAAKSPCTVIYNGPIDGPLAQPSNPSDFQVVGFGHMPVSEDTKFLIQFAKLGDNQQTTNANLTVPKPGHSGSVVVTAEILQEHVRVTYDSIVTPLPTSADATATLPPQ